MITPRIEKAILSGWATYQKVNHAFSSFGGVVIPKGKTAIILDVKWNHFFNPYQDEFRKATLHELQKYSEYQLKIDGNKSTNFLIFKNIIDFIITSPTASIDMNLDFGSQTDTFKKFVQFKHSLPIQQDVFFVCENYINLTITRNQFINNIATDFQPLNPVANQAPVPYGVGQQNLLTSQRSQSIGGIQWVYTPPNNPNAAPNTFAGIDLQTQSYTQPYDKESLLHNTKDEEDYIYFANPLVELGIVIFNSNDFDKIANQ